MLFNRIIQKNFKSYSEKLFYGVLSINTVFLFCNVRSLKVKRKKPGSPPCISAGNTQFISGKLSPGKLSCLVTRSLRNTHILVLFLETLLPSTLFEKQEQSPNLKYNNVFLQGIWKMEKTRLTQTILYISSASKVIQHHLQVYFKKIFQTSFKISIFDRRF